MKGYGDMRTYVYERDNFTCNKCGVKCRRKSSLWDDKKMPIAYMIPFIPYKKLMKHRNVEYLEDLYTIDELLDERFYRVLCGGCRKKWKGIV